MSMLMTVCFTKCFPLLLQKLEEFLFCMEDNHAEVGHTNTAWSSVISVVKVSVTLTQGLLGHR